jgi:hypothetical protein
MFLMTLVPPIVIVAITTRSLPMKSRKSQRCKSCGLLSRGLFDFFVSLKIEFP